jgi:hypothetical protein
MQGIAHTTFSADDRWYSISSRNSRFVAEGCVTLFVDDCNSYEVFPVPNSLMFLLNIQDISW